jgi:hypothetical protein
MQAIGALIDWFDGLDSGTKTLIESVAALYAGWRLLNMGFLASPIGIIVAFGTAILALYDDYKVWKEGGKSLIDWGKWEPQIQAAVAGLKDLGAELSTLAHVLLNIFGPALTAIGDILLGAIKAGFGNLLDMVTLITDVLTGKWDQAGQKAKDIMARTASFAKDAFASALAGVRGTVDAAQASMNSGGASAPSASSPSASIANPADPRGIRNNNPGNLNYVGQAGATKEGGPNGRFAVFRSAEDGLRALADQLRRYGTRGINSVRAIISKFAPASENNTQAYIGSVSKGLGIGADSALDLNDPRVLQSLMGAIIKVENGKNPYSAEQIAAASGARAAGAQGNAPISVSQTTTIHVDGSSDPHATAQAVAQAQGGVNQRLVRNMQPKAQ